jgi:hypothetical protein
MSFVVAWRSPAQDIINKTDDTVVGFALANVDTARVVAKGQLPVSGKPARKFLCLCGRCWKWCRMLLW